MAGTAVRGRLSPQEGPPSPPHRLAWLTATVSAVADETATARTISLSAPGWAGHRAGQHVDVRLTAEDGYQAERAYSIASAPGEPLALTVERLEEGEVSPYLTQEARPGDQFEVRGPIGGYFVWDTTDGGPLLLVAGGSGVVPLRSILRYRSAVGSTVPARLLSSSRSWEDVIYRAEFDAEPAGVSVTYALTRKQPPGWTGYARRVDQAMLAEVAWPAAEGPLAYVCGPTSFVEGASSALVALGYPARRVRTERFGATGQ
jgi:ferredoxin-NADP reductase